MSDFHPSSDDQPDKEQEIRMWTRERSLPASALLCIHTKYCFLIPYACSHDTMAPSAAPAKPKTAGTTSKACFANLPLELKARIVSLAEQQDAAYEARMVVYREAKEWKDKLGGGG